MSEQRPVIARPSLSEANRVAAISRKWAADEVRVPLPAGDQEITTSWEKAPPHRNDSQ
ncbi:MAG: hypothetical protein U5K69_22650 [Balneolaceae bacterium]|nr:hypothetical protein [Balneolaceae bacterium]